MGRVRGFHIMLKERSKGFSLIELLIVIAIIGILAAASFTSLNTGTARGKARNLERESDINLILNAVYQYATDNNGSFPGPDPIPTGSPIEICFTEDGSPPSCSGHVNLSDLTNASEYLVKIPIDPQENSSNGTGYTIVKTGSGRITISAPLAESGDTISETR